MRDKRVLGSGCLRVRMATAEDVVDQKNNFANS